MSYEGTMISRNYILVFTVTMTIFLVIGCKDRSVGPETAKVEIEENLDEEDKTDVPQDQNEDAQNDSTVYIVDQTGKKWDVTHAQEKYGMDPEKFQFGLVRMRSNRS